MAAARDVEEYLSGLPPAARTALEGLRKTIRAAAPEAVEVISYQVPTFRLGGPLVSFWATKSHCSFCLMSTSVMDAYQDELKGYDTAKATIRFQPGKPPPARLIQKLVRARISENKTRAARTRR